MTLIRYKVYKSEMNRDPILSLNEITQFEIRGKKKYVGKKAKIEAISRALGVVLPNSYTTTQINDYIGANVFNTSKWAEYHKVFKEVREEMNVISSKLIFQYTLIVELKSKLPINDDVLMHFAFCELMGTSIEEYKGVKNPILKLKKEYDKGEGFIVY